jgi:cellulose synthase/poly-beta-1,6-N-acetylglucosamine synthase-like glycosyltransferase
MPVETKTFETARRDRLGEILCNHGDLSPEHLEAALVIQRQTRARLGEVLLARGWLPRERLQNALAKQAGLGTVALAPRSSDRNLIDARDIDVYLRRRLLPWRRDSDGLHFVSDSAPEALAGLRELADPQPQARLSLVDPAALDAALLETCGPALAARAAARCSPSDSARSGMPAAQRFALLCLVVAVIAGLVLSPGVTVALILTTMILLNALNALARIAVLGAALRRQPSHPDAAPGYVADSTAPLTGPVPCFSILIPLLREPEVLPLLIEGLERLDWPSERLDVLLILEEGDEATSDALAAMRLPVFCRTLVIPEGGPRTKPRALNLALDFARGDVIGIYDAEDRPEPDQLRRVAAMLAESASDVACIQCRLSYYNPRENWLTRCFSIEYAMWFDVLIAGFSDLGLPIPLGGTSVFFRRHALESLGGWDAHNVTEDADLGMRLVRRGWRCGVSRSTTFEEANSRLLPWIRQRSRWLKGYIITWLVHMRRPLALWREMGPAGFIGFQTVFLGAIVAYLGLPLFWAFWATALTGTGPQWLAATPLWLLWSVAIVQIGGWLAMLLAAVIATRRRGQSWLLPWVPSLLLYWPIGAAAAYLALAELLVAPTLWRKTRHGVGRVAAAELARARQSAPADPFRKAVEKRMAR